MQVWLRRAAGAAVDLLFPPQCVFCAAELERVEGTPLCPRCREALVDEQRVPCPRCAAPLPQLVEKVKDCIHCRGEKFAFAWVVALGAYEGPLQEAVPRMKQPQGEALTIALGRLLAERVARREAALDAIAPIPMHWLRRMSRGVDDAGLLAETAASRLRLPVLSDVLTPRRLHRRQHKLTAADRRLNMRGAFNVSKRFDLSGAKILVIDDALTTGATAHAAATALKKAGAEEVAVAVVARGIGA